MGKLGVFSSLGRECIVTEREDTGCGPRESSVTGVSFTCSPLSMSFLLLFSAQAMGKLGVFSSLGRECIVPEREDTGCGPRKKERNPAQNFSLVPSFTFSINSIH